MFKIMIVDDELKIRTGLSKFIDWKSFDCKVIHVAVNGEDAINKIKQQKPDIILADIRMPKINGIELSKYVYEKEPSIEVIILTGYADFEYSKKAIQYDIVDFVLKPTSPEKIAKAVNKAKGRIIEKRTLNNRIHQLEHELEKNNENMIELTLHKIINNVPVDTETINSYLKPSIPDSNCKHCCLLINVDYKNTEEKVEHYYLENIHIYINEIFSNIPHYIIVEDHHNICIFLLFSRNNDIHNLENTVTYCTELIDTVKIILNFELKIGISLFHDKIDAIYACYHEAKEALNNQFYFGTEQIYIYCYTCQQSNVIQSLHSAQENVLKLIALLDDSNDEYEIISTIETTFDLLKNEFIDMGTARSYSLLIYSYMIQFNDTKHLSKASLEKTNQQFIKLNEAKNIDALKVLLMSVYDSITATKSLNYDNELVNRVNVYIANNYDKNISLSSIANSIPINSCYLSRLYKKITHQTLTTYITKYRIEKAIELLKTTDMKIYKIGESVGIEDATYFSQLFKKYTEHNPTYYRQRRA